MASVQLEKKTQKQAQAKQKLIRLGQINFINCLPINFALKEYLFSRDFGKKESSQEYLKAYPADFDYQFEIFDGVPSSLNDKLYKNELDIAPISAFEYLKHKDNYNLLADLSVSAKSYADSVLFFSKTKLENLKTIYLTPKSASSVALLKIILNKKYNLHDLEYKVFDSHQELDNKLLIGDEALFEEQAGYDFVLDLGKEWFELTGLPMVFGLWAYNKSFSMQGNIQDFFQQIKDDGFGQLLDRAIDYARDEAELKRDLLVQYFNHLDYDFTDKHQESLELFETYLHELKLI